MVMTTMFIEEAEIIPVTAIYLGISDLALGIIIALIFGCVIFIVKCGKQCRDNVKWIIEICKMNFSKGTKEKGEMETSVEESDKEKIAETKEEISELSQQIKGILAEIKQIRKTEVMKALEDDIKTALTEYAMKFELRRPEYDKAMKILQVMLANIPEEDIAYHTKVNQWISKAQKKFEEYAPKNFIQKVEAIKARREGAE